MIPFNNMCMSPMERDMKHNQDHLKAMRELDDFKKCITDTLVNYIEMIDTKISTQDLKIDQAIIYIKENIDQVASDILTNALDEGRITLKGIYDPDTESLTIGGEIV